MVTFFSLSTRATAVLPHPRFVLFCLRAVTLVFLSSQPGVNSLSQAQRELFFGQHAALITVRPNAEFYDEISHLLCKVRALRGR